jgi:hypothetical protein
LSIDNPISECELLVSKSLFCVGWFKESNSRDAFYLLGFYLLLALEQPV